MARTAEVPGKGLGIFVYELRPAARLSGVGAVFLSKIRRIAARLNMTVLIGPYGRTDHLMMWQPVPPMAALDQEAAKKLVDGGIEEIVPFAQPDLGPR